jgi:biopolymer transport protein ExbD
MKRSLGRIGRKSIEEPTVNLTPLIDVVFVILIGFIIIAPLLELDRIELASAPKTSSDSSVSIQEPSLIAIHVKSDNTIWYKNQQMLLPMLEKKLQEEFVRYPKVIPQLFHDKKGYFGTYQDVKNALEGAGFDRVDIILQP